MCAELVKKFDDELNRLRLGGQDLLDLLGLNKDLSRPGGCSGPCLAAAWKAWEKTPKNTGEFMICLRNRATHVFGAFERLKNDKHEGRELAEERHKRHNNAMKFVDRGKEQAEDGQRFLHLLHKSKIYQSKATLTWSCCNTSPTIDLPPHQPVSQNRVDKSAPSPPKEGCTQNDGDEDDDDDDGDDGDASVQKAGPAAVPAKPKIICLCGKEAKSPRKFKTHGAHCPRIPQQARAKIMKTSSRKCIWGCDLSFSVFTSLWTHEQLPHYLSASGKIGTKRRVGSLTTTKLEPAEYFSSVDGPDTEAFLENKAVEVASGMDPDSARLVLQNMEVFVQKLRPALQKQSVIDGSDTNVRSVSIEPSPEPEQSQPIASDGPSDVPTAPPQGTKRKRASEDTQDAASIVVAPASPTIANATEGMEGINAVSEKPFPRVH